MGSLLLIFILLMYLRMSKALFGSYFAPLGIYGLVWLGALLLYSIPVFNYRPLNFLTIMVIGLSFGSFTIGALTVALGTKINLHRQKGSGVKRITPVSSRVLLRYAIIALSIAGFTGIINLFTRVISVYGILGLISEASRIRVQLAVFGREVALGKAAIYSLGLTFAAGALSGFYLGYYKKSFLFAYLPVISIIIFAFVYWGRAEVLVFFLLFSICYVIGLRSDIKKVKSNTNISNIKPFIAWRVRIFLVLFIAVFVLIAEVLNKGAIEQQFARVHLPSVLLNVYAYIATPIPALDVALSRPIDHYLLGQATFYPIARALYRIGLLSDVANTSYVLDIVRTPVPSNTFTYLRPLFEDFGLLGVILIPFLLGVASSYLFILVRTVPSLFSAVLMAYIYVVLIFSIQGNQFWNITFAFSFMVAAIVGAAMSYRLRRSGALHGQKSEVRP